MLLRFAPAFRRAVLLMESWVGRGQPEKHTSSTSRPRAFESGHHAAPQPRARVALASVAIALLQERRPRAHLVADVPAALRERW
jgi:hypothetical protein